MKLLGFHKYVVLNKIKITKKKNMEKSEENVFPIYSNPNSITRTLARRHHGSCSRALPDAELKCPGTFLYNLLQGTDVSATE